jgi:two-component system response regulator FixJ
VSDHIMLPFEFVIETMNGPVFKSDNEPGSTPDAVSSERSAHLAEQVYVVDDDLAVLKVIETMLRMSGYEVRAYSSPTEFLADSEQLPPGVVVTDQVMHLVQGIEVQRRLSARPNHFKVILVTAFSTTSLAVAAMKNGAVTVLDKPFDRAELLAAVKEAFRQLKHVDSFNEVLPPVLPQGNSYLDRLSPRERDVILLIYKGGTNKSAGIQLGISFKTVEKHRSSAMKKLEVSSVACLVRLLNRDLGR